jgi:predicted negative regulator of RcsB-dependent stress response
MYRRSGESGGSVLGYRLGGRLTEAEVKEMQREMDAVIKEHSSMEKHPISPGEVLPVRELYGDMLLEEGRTQDAVAAYEASLERTPNRRYAEAGIERATGSR